ELPMGAQLAALHTNENGAQTTVNGWFHAAMIGLPVMDFACNGRAHPTSMMGALGLHSEDDYQSVQCFAGGRGARSTEGVARGSLAAASGIVRRASVEAGGLVAVARNPVTVGYALAHGAPGAISHAMAVGQHFLEGGLAAVAAFLGGRIVAEGVVAEYACRQDGGLDVGHLRLDDEGGTFIAFVNEYMLLDQAGRRMADFPDLIMTFDGQGKPVVSAHVKTGMPLQVLRVPADRLLLSRTMRMPELFDPVRALLGMDFGPVQQDVLQTAI
ncbi:MAG: DUF917 family protein, partial [Burkholderiaceae bacterium]